MRLQIGDERLSNLMLISVENDTIKNYVIDLLVDKFGKMGNRRYPVAL